MNFIFISNRFSIDLINTMVVMEGEAVDLLSTPDKVADWAKDQGLELKQGVSKQGFDEIKSLRALMQQWVSPPQPSSRALKKNLDRLNGYLKHRGDCQKLVVSDGEYRIESVARPHTEQSLIRSIALDFAELLAADKLSLIKQCASERCILTFLDTSRSKRRRWCSMETCGNRAKASNFYHGHSVSN